MTVKLIWLNLALWIPGVICAMIWGPVTPERVILWTVAFYLMVVGIGVLILLLRNRPVVARRANVGSDDGCISVAYWVIDDDDGWM
jgi:predicted acyltransferase